MSDMNEMAPWGKQYGRTSKTDFRNITINLGIEIQNYKTIIYFRDLFYNPCHDIDNALIIAKQTDNYEV